MAITPYLYYEDVATARGFLSKAFGFRNLGRAKREKDGTIRHAAMKLGEDMVMMGCPGSGYRNPRRLEQATQCLYIEVAEVDGLFERAKKAGAKILEEPADTDYGQRRFGVEDPEGHQWYFAKTIG